MSLTLLAMTAPGSAEPLLINAQQGTFRTRPEYVREHFAHIDSLPFDGMVLRTDTSRNMMFGNPRSYEQMVSDFAPLSGLSFTRMPDLDGDGIPDPLEGAPYVVGVDDLQIDSDGDGVSNAGEYLAGTGPLNGNSRLHVTPLNAPAGGAAATSVTLSFPTVAGLNYAADFTDSLDGGIWTLVPGSERTGDGTQLSVTDESGSPARFYRLHAWR